MASFILGLDAKLYLSTSLINSPSWVEVDEAKNVTLTLSKGTADVTTRASAGWRLNAGTLKEASVSFEINWDPTSNNFDTIRDAFTDNSVIGVAVYDQDKDTPGALGLLFDGIVSEFTIGQELEQAQTVSVTIIPSLSSNAPQWSDDHA